MSSNFTCLRAKHKFKLCPLGKKRERFWGGGGASLAGSSEHWCSWEYAEHIIELHSSTKKASRAREREGSSNHLHHDRRAHRHPDVKVYALAVQGHVRVLLAASPARVVPHRAHAPQVHVDAVFRQRLGLGWVFEKQCRAAANSSSRRCMCTR